MFVEDDNIEFFNLNTKYFNKDNYSLNSSFYQNDVELYVMMIKIFEENGIEIKKISEISYCNYVPNRAKTIFVEKENGFPYLSPKDTFTFPLSAEKYSLEFPESCQVIDKWLLITCSGTTGRSIISNNLFKNFVISNDMIRLSVSSDYLGYIYAFINTNMGKNLIKRHEYGSTVKHINPEHIELLKIPIFYELKDEINDLIIKSHEIRENAQFSMQTSIKNLYDFFNLPIIGPKQIKNGIDENYDKNRCFNVNANQLQCRFDGSFHDPIYTNNMKNLSKKAESDEFYLCNLEDFVDIYVPPRFKRNYVDDENESVPLLQGSHITQIKPQGLKRIYSGMKNIEKYVVKEGMILLTGSGTIGNLSLVSKYWDNWTATNHLIRFVPKNESINPGYLLLFLLSDYAQIQLDHIVYGSNVDEIAESGDLLNKIKILAPYDKNIENKLGDAVIEAYNNRDKANLIEETAINKLESKINETYSKFC
ncbi:restriction endonuclease subunit S [uncultured Methanobrevibacter sp.]|uniref:restriction endonuclease subunit S n=1 Tax=uncultured Methanobrevibacter sp. TaxID=253161 RepID=UPI0025D3271A|nr:restriction endonuclease subunit S [uncultured Methanobrevibacter sp.]